MCYLSLCVRLSAQQLTRMMILLLIHLYCLQSVAGLVVHLLFSSTSTGGPIDMNVVGIHGELSVFVLMSGVYTIWFYFNLTLDFCFYYCSYHIAWIALLSFLLYLVCSKSTLTWLSKGGNNVDFLCF